MQKIRFTRNCYTTNHWTPWPAPLMQKKPFKHLYTPPQLYFWTSSQTPLIFQTPILFETQEYTILSYYLPIIKLNFIPLAKCKDCNMFVPCDHGQVKGPDGCLKCECIEPSVKTGKIWLFRIQTRLIVFIMSLMIWNEKVSRLKKWPVKSHN